MPEPAIPSPTYNIVLLGPTQSGKTTFVQSIRKYADPTCSVDRTNIGGSTTQQLLVHRVDTNFPDYRLFTNSSRQASTREIDLDKLTTKLTSTYSTPLFSSLFRRTVMDSFHAGVVCKPITAPSSPISSLNIVDAPPLDGALGGEVRHIANVLSALRRLGPIHLVLIMVSTTAPIYNVDSLEAFADICQNMGDLIVFVHTKARPQDLSCTKWEQDMQGRKRTLEAIFCRDQRSPVHFVIDCDLTARDPALIAIRNHVIHKILLRATKTTPVDVSNMLVSKSKKMLKVDAEVVMRFHMTMRDLILNQISNLGVQFNYRLKIDDLERVIQDIDDYLGKYDSEAPIPMFETFYEDDWEVGDPFSFGREVVLQASDLPYDIIYVNEDCHGFEKKILVNDRKLYKVKLTRRCYTRGTYSLKVFTSFKTQYQQQLSMMRNRRRFFERTLTDLRREAEYNYMFQNWLQEHRRAESQLERSREEMVERRESCLRAIRHLDQLSLSIGAFIKAAGAGLYEGFVEECADKAVDYFTNPEAF
ncbi:hypothetical protein BGZ72_003345 [Mortierella alpina]|nr:hypothetical protein BGZ72_003345 [Mortierella alpina]